MAKPSTCSASAPSRRRLGRRAGRGGPGAPGPAPPPAGAVAGGRAGGAAERRAPQRHRRSCWPSRSRHPSALLERRLGEARGVEEVVPAVVLLGLGQQRLVDRLGLRRLLEQRVGLLLVAAQL